ncbi:MAG TPA: 2-oxoglutarate dehydrogenase complex dihydrolipoyllysine-residue succinyltransferase [Phycisphaerales bacterium]|nr:2-oxoglutarate dehydrogenase complex dihydrolipoyllysine-residue succinyltransferase [Phycisphaerales bacterium]
MPIDIIIPQAGESVTSGVISRWLKNDGDFVKRDEPVLELETDKVTMEIPAPAEGSVKQSAKAGDTVKIGQVVGSIAEGAAPAASASAPAKAEAKAASPEPKASAPVATAAPAAPAASAGHAASAGEDVRATPLAKKLADENHVDLGKVVGTGAGGRIREQDVLAYMQSHQPGSANGTTAAAPVVVAHATGTRNATRDRMTPLRQRIAQRLVQAQHTAAMLTTFNEVDMGPVMELRKQYKEEFEKKHAIGLGFMGFFVKAVCTALKAFPAVNSYIVEDESGNLAIEKHDYCDVAIAVSTPKGLVVPVLRNAHLMSLADVEKGIKELATKAKDGKLTIEDMTGGTFTITNGGVFGSLMSTPILNPPQSGILGMHAIKNRPIEYPAASGQIALRPMMYLAHSYDHRIIDGAEAVQFLVKVKQCIEDPQRMLLEL